jgi:hypothetical protein
MLRRWGRNTSWFWSMRVGTAPVTNRTIRQPTRSSAALLTWQLCWIGGQHPFARDQSGFRQWLRHGIAEGPDALVTAFESMAGPIPEAYADRLRTADLQAWLAAVEDRVSNEDVLGTMTMPCCLYAGDADPIFAQAKQASERIPNAVFFALPGLSHLEGFLESRRVLPPIMEFLAKS